MFRYPILNNHHASYLSRGYPYSAVRIHRYGRVIPFGSKLEVTLCVQLSWSDAEPSPLHTATIVEKCTQKLVDEFHHMRCQATEPLATFLDYIT